MKKTNIDMIDNAMLYLVLVVKAKHLLPLSREDDEECLKSLDPFHHIIITVDPHFSELDLADLLPTYLHYLR
jgi:hypothetical protein